MSKFAVPRYRGLLDLQTAQFTLPYSATQLADLQALFASVFPNVGLEVSGIEFNYLVKFTATKDIYAQAINYIFPNAKPYTEY